MAGVAGAIARDTSPVASGAVTGFQWFALGGSFWCTSTRLYEIITHTAHR